MFQIFSTAFFISGGIETILNYNGPKYFYLYDHENKISYVRNYFLRGVITKYKTGRWLSGNFIFSKEVYLFTISFSQDVQLKMCIKNHHSNLYIIL